jgi:hypothetical protein
MVCLMQTVHLSFIKINTISKLTEVSIEPHQLGVPSSASKTILELLVRLAQTVHLSCTDSNIISEWTKIMFHLSLVT